jgi:hypothetical protein
VLRCASVAPVQELCGACGASPVIHGMQEARGSNPLSSTTPVQRLFFEHEPLSWATLRAKLIRCDPSMPAFIYAGQALGDHLRATLPTSCILSKRHDRVY